MAIATPTVPMSGANLNNTNPYDTAVVTLTAGRLYILHVTAYASGGGAAPTSVVHNPAGTALNFALVTDGTDNGSQTYEASRNHSIWYVIPAATTASALIRITYSGTRSACGWQLIEVASGFDATGGATTFPQVVLATGTTTAIAATLASFANTDCLMLLFAGWGSSTSTYTQTVTPTESRTELYDSNDTERSAFACHYQNPNGGDVSVGMTLSAANTWACIAVELKATAAAATTSLIHRPDPLKMLLVA